MDTASTGFIDARRALLECLQVLESVGSLDSGWPKRNQALRVARKAVEAALRTYVEAAAAAGISVEDDEREKTATDISVAELRKATAAEGGATS